VVEACLAGGVGNRRTDERVFGAPSSSKSVTRGASNVRPRATWALSDKASELKDRARQKIEEMRGGPVTK
jgi:hypothetical protein